MDGETSVPPMTLGTVRSVVRDPFEDDAEIINVAWDNGNSLGLLSVTDRWVKAPQEQIEESASPQNQYDFLSKNPDVFENFDWRFFRQYLTKLRDSGVINMFQAVQFLYSGKEWIDRYHGEDQEDNEDFQEVLEMAEESKDKIVQGVIKYMESKNMDFDDMSRFNRYAQQFSQKLLQLYMNF
jgi:hypothetical protein